MGRPAHDRIDPGDAGAVDDVVGRTHGLAELLGIEHVTGGDAKVRVVGEVGLRQSIARKIIVHHDAVCIDDASGDGAPDEARTPGDDDD